MSCSFDLLTNSRCHAAVGTDERGDTLYCGEPVVTRRPPRCASCAATSFEPQEVRDKRLARSIREARYLSFAPAARSSASSWRMKGSRTGE